jgi:hypothetical protein
MANQVIKNLWRPILRKLQHWGLGEFWKSRTSQRALSQEALSQRALSQRALSQEVLSQGTLSQGGIMERKITLAQPQNKVTVTVSNAQSIEILDSRGQMIERVGSNQILVPQIFYLQGGDYQVVSDGQINDVTTETADIPAILEFSQLMMLSDAKDVHVVDGIGEIPADGESFTTITIQKLDTRSAPLQREQDNDEIFLRTTAGLVKDAQGNQEIRSLRLVGGQGSFRLYSEAQKRVATVEALSTSPFLSNASIRIEFF